MRMWQGVRTGFGHGGITCVLPTQFSSFFFFCFFFLKVLKIKITAIFFTSLF